MSNDKKPASKKPALKKPEPKKPASKTGRKEPPKTFIWD